MLWTKQEFEGDLFISFEMTRVDTSTYGATPIYIQKGRIGLRHMSTRQHIYRDFTVRQL